MKNTVIKNRNKKNSIQALKSFLALSSLVLVSLFISSCANSSTAGKTEVKNAEENVQVTSNVSLSKLKYDALKIQMGTIEMKNLINVLKSTGFLHTPPQAKANITLALGGTVQSILVQEGNYVRKGQTVLTITNPEFIKMQEAFLDTKSQLIFAEAEYNRQKELSSKNVSSQKTFQQVESNYNSLRVKFNSLKQQLILLGISTTNLTQDNISSAINVVSPINGSISKIYINIGANAEASKTLMDIVDNTHLHLDLFVFEQELPKIRKGQTIDFSLTNLPGKIYSAEIYSIGSAFENETKTIPLHAEITGNKAGLIEGMNVTGSINIGNKLVPAVPSSAIESFSGNDYIFITFNQDRKEGEKGHTGDMNQDKELPGTNYSFKRIQVKKGVTNAGYTEITPLEEIPDHVKIVVSGTFYLMAMLTNKGEE